MAEANGNYSLSKETVNTLIGFLTRKEMSPGL